MNAANGRGPSPAAPAPPPCSRPNPTWRHSPSTRTCWRGRSAACPRRRRPCRSSCWTPSRTPATATATPNGSCNASCGSCRTASSSSAAATVCSGPIPPSRASSTTPAPPPGPACPPQAGQPARAAGQGGARQHLIGDFSEQDCDTYLAHRLTQDGQPLISPDIRAVITQRSHGLPLHLDLAVARFLEIRRTGRTPTPADFDHTFPALIARTLSGLTADERHVLRSASLLDAFDLDLATHAAGLTHQAAARRLIEWPMITEDPYAIWPYHLHGAIRTALRTADDHTEDRWTSADWHRAAERALAALGQQRQDGRADVPGRTLLVACLRQGLRLARDHRLDDLSWLTDAAFAYTDDSVWEPLAPPTHALVSASGTGPDTGPATPADALAELLVAIGRRQHEHRERTAERLTAVLGTGLLSGELAELALYYRAKAHKDLGRTDAAADGMRQVADAGGRLAVRARRGLANLARIRGDFPTALAAVPTLGWKGRHHRVLGHIRWPHGDIDRATAAFEAARTEAEQHDAPGERAIAQTHIALVTAFADPARADDELALAHQLLAHLDQRATTLLAHVVGLVRDAGTDRDVTDRAAVLRTEITVAGLAWLTPLLETALAFHHAVRGAQDDLAATLDRLREATANGDFAYYVHIAAAMGDLPQPAGPAIRWLDDEPTVCTRWRALVTARQHRLHGTNGRFSRRPRPRRTAPQGAARGRRANAGPRRAARRCGQGSCHTRRTRGRR